MFRIIPKTIESAPAESLLLLAKVRAKNGFIPNLLAVLCNYPIRWRRPSSIRNWPPIAGSLPRGAER